MIEGQEGVTWEDWVALARAAEQHGFDALFRSDHYGPVETTEERGALDAWATLAGLAAVTDTIKLGTLVSPATFRHPSVFAKSAVTVDHISGGRVEAGLGAGWNEAEHASYGFPFPPLGERMDAFAEQLEIVRRQWEGERFSFEGEHYRLTDSNPLPKPLDGRRMPLIVGGGGKRRSVALAARWADEYNTVSPSVEDCRRLKTRIAEACEREGREPLTLSTMTGFLIGADDAELRRREGELGPARDGWIAGTPDEAVRQLTEFAEAGVERVMLQHLLHTDLEVLELIAREVATQLR